MSSTEVSVVDKEGLGGGQEMPNSDTVITERITNGMTTESCPQSITYGNTEIASATEPPRGGGELRGAEGGQEKKKKVKKLWRVVKDEVSGANYYYNRMTGETTWAKPSDEDLRLECSL